MSRDLSNMGVYEAISGWRVQCLEHGVSLHILSGGLGMDGWIDSEVQGGVSYFVFHFRVSLIFTFLVHFTNLCIKCSII
jgi:hypothetical protein